MKKYNKLSQRLFKIISLVMIIVFMITYIGNNYIAEQYLLYKNNYNLDRVYNEIQGLTMDQLIKNSNTLEQKYKISIIWFSYKDHEEYFNNELRNRLAKQKLTLNRIWLIEDTIKKLDDGKKIRRLYDQGKLKSSFLVNFFKKEDRVVVIGESIPHVRDVIHVFNEISFVLWISTLMLLIIFVWWYMKKVTKPIEKLQRKSQEIADLNFSQIHIQTGDELEALANSINFMSLQLSDALNKLDTKNTRLKTLISDISHEMKTPLSLINIYAYGIEDGLDDGTYSKGIIKETKTLVDLINDLLNLSKLEQQPLEYKEVDAYSLVKEIQHEYEIIIRKKNININIDNSIRKTILVDRDKIKTVFKNLIYNGIKYTKDQKLDIVLKQVDEHVMIRVINGVDDSFDKEKVKHLFEPFYVMDESRSKELSGNGLGLTIVGAILDQHGIGYHVKIENKKFIFEIIV